MRLDYVLLAEFLTKVKNYLCCKPNTSFLYLKSSTEISQISSKNV